MAAVGRGLHVDHAGRVIRCDLDAVAPHAIAVEFAHHECRVLINPHGAEHQRRVAECRQVPRHIERCTAHHGAGLELVHQHFAEHGNARHADPPGVSAKCGAKAG